MDILEVKGWLKDLALSRPLLWWLEMGGCGWGGWSGKAVFEPHITDQRGFL